AGPSWSAPRRASSTSATEQQPESEAPPHSLSVAPTTWSRPYCSATRAAATEESTPPDRATSTRIPSVSQLRDRARHDGQGVVDVRLGGRRPEGDPDAAGGLLAREPHRLQHVAGLHRAAGAGRAGCHRHTRLVEQDDERLPLG